MVTLDEVVDLIRREMRGKRGKLLEGEELRADTRLEDLGLSSLQVADIVFTLEEEHDTEFDEARAAEVKTIGDLVDLGNAALTPAGEDGRAVASDGLTPATELRGAEVA